MAAVSAGTATPRRRPRRRRWIVVALLVLLVLVGAVVVGGGTLVADRLASSLAVPPGGGPVATGDEPNDPQTAFGVPYQQIRYPCAGATCPAWFVPGRSSTWMVLVHGKGAPLSDPLRAMGPALRDGLPILDIGYRNDPGAPVDPSHRYGMGATEWHDLDQAVDYAVAHGAGHLVLFGSSMGGAIVASFMEHSSSASLVRGVILDAPALDLESIVDSAVSHGDVPGLGASVPGVFLWAGKRIASLRYGIDWRGMDYADGTWLHVPALVFHGTADRTVPIAVSDRFRAAHPDLVQEVRVPGAGHVGSYDADHRGYTDREAAFLACVTAAQPAPSCPAAG